MNIIIYEHCNKIYSGIQKICVNEEKVNIAGCSTGSKEFLRRKVDKNAANMKHRNTPRINNNNLFSVYCGVSNLLHSKDTKSLFKYNTRQYYASIIQDNIIQVLFKTILCKYYSRQYYASIIPDNIMQVLYKTILCKYYSRKYYASFIQDNIMQVLYKTILCKYYSRQYFASITHCLAGATIFYFDVVRFESI